MDVNWYMIDIMELVFSVVCIFVNFKIFKKGICWVVYMWYMGDDDLGRVMLEDFFCVRDGDRVGFEF